MLVASDGGAAEIKHSIRHRQHRPQPGWVEHDPTELLDNIRSCVQIANETGPLNAIGLANQGESCLAWDARSGAPLSPVIVWQDCRTAETVERLRTDGCEIITRERAGLPLDTYFSASKLAWILRNVPEAAEALRRKCLRIGTTDAYFLDRLTGVFATDVSTASRTSLMNMETCEWDSELCRLFDVPLESLPEIRPSVGCFGDLDRVSVTAAIVDQQAALYGHGCRQAGDAKITFGTGAFMLALTGNKIIRAPEQGLLSTVAWQIGNRPAVFALDGGVHDAGAVLEWIHHLGLFSDFAELAEFDAAPAVSRGLVFVPALSGLACPHWDRRAAGLWIGMRADTSRADLCQAALEGIVFAVAEVVSAIGSRIGVADRLSVDGGLVGSPYFVQFLADITGRSIVTQSNHELTAHGCAALAALGLRCELPAIGSKARIHAPRQVEAKKWHERYTAARSCSMRWC